MNLDSVKSHYQACFERHGKTPHGMGWKDHDAQYVRFKALAALWEEDRGSVNDWGCGDGSFGWWVDGKYVGYDISPRDLPVGEFILSDKPTQVADYTIASGIFNVRKEHSEAKWWDYICESIKVMRETSRKGFGFNILSVWCDRKDPELYYARPFEVMTQCQRYSNRILFNHLYSPYDFTILVHL